MADRVVSIELVANASGLVRGMKAAKDATGELRDEIQESAVSQREAWSRIGTGLTAVGVAMTGVMALTLKTGVAYNTLQQTSRAALTTLLGSARAANGQMDKLDDFARNSPFAKQVFIKAQQQMLGFGVAAENVIPALDAVQNAVAAMGGSNEQIASISEILSRIKSEGRLSGDALQRLGYYGIDAAALIGSQMGKTSAEIRDMASKPGGIPVDQIWDPLVNGMQSKFGGAAANVKNTFEGAMDRVKAAFRDFASELAKPLVDPNGGGALIDLLNWTADAMRNFQALPEPVKATVSALTGLVGVGSLVAGVGLLGYMRWIEFQAALATVGATSGVAKAGLLNVTRFMMGPWGVALIAAAASLAVFNKGLNDTEVSSSKMLDGFKQGKSIIGQMRAEAEKTDSWLGMSQAIDDAGDALDRYAYAGNGVMGVFAGNTINQNKFIDNLKEVGVGLGQLASNDLPAAIARFQEFGREAKLDPAQMEIALGLMDDFKSELISYAESAGLATDDTTLMNIALGYVGDPAKAAANSLEGIQGAAVDTADAITNLADEITNFGKSSIDSERASIQFEEQLAALNARVAEGAAGMNLQTEAGQKNRASLLDMAEATNRAAGAAANAGASQEEVNDTLTRGRDALIQAAIQYGATEAEAKAYADQLIATPETVSTKANLDTTSAKSQFSAWLSSMQGKTVTVIGQMAFKGGVNPSAALNHAYGGTVGFAQGGTITKAATGVTVGGIGGAVMDGTVYGAGTAKSDSILVALSKGEEVTQEPYASMYRADLKAMNRGDYHPAQPAIVVQSSPYKGAQVNVYGHRGMDVDQLADAVFERIEGRL